MRFVGISLAPTLVMLAALAAGVGPASAQNSKDGQPSAQAGDAQKGKAAFIQHGCWQCHDFNGQGSVATSNGKVIARTQLPLDAFIAFVRTTNGQMPPFHPAILSDEDLTNIYAYLQSLPAPKSASDIPLLNNDTRTQ
jgi:mono/diheme cytochrome c family protein